MTIQVILRRWPLNAQLWLLCTAGIMAYSVTWFQTELYLKQSPRGSQDPFCSVYPSLGTIGPLWRLYTTSQSTPNQVFLTMKLTKIYWYKASCAANSLKILLLSCLLSICWTVTKLAAGPCIVWVFRHLQSLVSLKSLLSRKINTMRIRDYCFHTFHKWLW